MRERGVVKMVSTNQRYFFIRPDSGSDVFAHRSSLPVDVRVPAIGTRVEFTLGVRNGRPLATDVWPVAEPATQVVS